MFEAFDIIQLDRELAKRGLKHFIKMVWPIVEPSEVYIPNWHTDAICEHLEATLSGDIRRLVMSVPPGSMKSLSCCVFFPAYTWTKDAGHRFIFSSFSDRLSKRDSLKTRRIVESEYYQERWGEQVQLESEGYTIARFGTKKGGARLMTTVGGGITGEHGHTQVTDDPLKPLDLGGSLAASKNTLEKILTWWTKTMASRLVNPETSVRIIIMQRLAVNDLAGAMLKEGGWEHLMLPMEFEPKRKCFTVIGFEDPRTKEGELLCPKRFSPDAVAELKKEVGAREYRAQYQQDPVLTGGNIFNRKYAQFYSQLPKKFDRMVQSWDCAFKGADSSDPVSGQVWGLKGTDYYLVDRINDRMTFSETCRAVVQMSAKWPKAVKKYIEDKANGPAVVDYLKKKISGFELVNPEGGKESRAHAIEPLWEGGNIWLPSPEIAPWIEDFLVELEQFPSGAHDDDVDSMTQAVIKLYRRNIDRLRRAMQAV